MPLFGHFQFYAPTRFPEVICPRYNPARGEVGNYIAKTKHKHERTFISKSSHNTKFGHS